MYTDYINNKLTKNKSNFSSLILFYIHSSFFELHAVFFSAFISLSLETKNSSDGSNFKLENFNLFLKL